MPSSGQRPHQPRAEQSAARWLHARVRRRFVVLVLLKPDRITATHRATAHHGSIDADVDLVVLGCRAQDSRIHREIALREGGHHATPAMTGDVEAYGRPDDERVADPGILRKALLARGQLQHDVRTKLAQNVTT